MVKTNQTTANVIWKEALFSLSKMWVPSCVLIVLFFCHVYDCYSNKSVNKWNTFVTWKIIDLQKIHFDAATRARHLGDSFCVPQCPAKEERFTGERDDVIQEVARGTLEFRRRCWTGAGWNTAAEFVEAIARSPGGRCAPTVSRLCVFLCVPKRRDSVTSVCRSCSFCLSLFLSCGAVTDLRPAAITTRFHFWKKRAGVAPQHR